VKRLPIVLAAGVLLLAVAASGLISGGAFPGTAARPGGSAAAAGLPATPGASASAGPATFASPPIRESTQPSGAVVGPLADVPIVPVTQYRTTVEQIGRGDIQATLAGTSPRWDGLELVAAEADAILAGLGVDRPAGDGHLTPAADAAQLSADLAAHRKRLGVLRADAVGPSVRALGWGDRRLFGVGHAISVAAWGLTARLPQPEGIAVFDPAESWTLVAGGDILLDRGVAQTVKIRGKGVDFPFDGGTAEITSHCRNCSPLGWDLPRTRRTGDAGVVRALINHADIAIANFENPAPDRFRYHTSGTMFSADPKLIDGLAHAGIDWVGLANNHIRDAGATGILQTIANLRERGIAASGAGKNLAAARKPSILETHGTKVAFLAYDTIAKGYGAKPDRAGSAQMSAKVVRADVAAARAAGAQVVIVFPHWGTEYDPTPFRGQQTLARAALDAGADMVIGNHAHWAGAMEIYDGKPIWYALGNFIFDQTWSEPTMEGITLELTFRGAMLVQARMRPHIILDKAQPNFLDPAGDGRVVIGQVFDASKGMLPW
jgi:hypothetical protein